MDLISDIYTTIQSWCKADYFHVGYWLSWAISFIAGSSCGSPGSSPRRHQRQTDLSNKCPPIPHQVPSIVDIKRILPKHCFTPKLSWSMFYVGKDLLLCTALYALTLLVEKLPFHVLYYAWLPAYWILMGTMFWAIFVLGHDCGHGSFSTSNLLNDIMGTFLHTIICVPYYPWKLSHKHHHRNTGSIDHDEIFYPVRKKDDDGSSFITGFGFGLGWFLYLIIGFNPRSICHFNPYEQLFNGHVLGCIASMLSMSIWLYVLMSYFYAYGMFALITHYIAPLFVFGSWLVAVTFLHHMDVGVPWYDDNEWSNVRGQLSTVDRHYGWAHYLTHNIGTHQIHHLFSKIPHYYLEEATAAFRNKYPHLVRQSNEAIIPAFMRLFYVFAKERKIEDETKIYVWKGE